MPGSLGTLFVVATPIGNLEDVTLRALRMLREVAVIAAEDTRRTSRLLQHYSISTPTISLHEHNEHSRTAPLLDRLARGESVALVSDAGTPIVSDPGAQLVRAAHAAGVRVEPVPGAERDHGGGVGLRVWRRGVRLSRLSSGADRAAACLAAPARARNPSPRAIRSTPPNS